MHIVDIVFLCIATVVTIIGIKRGLIAEAFRLAAVAAGLVAATLFYRATAGMLGFIDVHEGVRVSVAFAAVFVAVLTGVLAVGWTVRKVVHLTVLGWVDRVCGGCLGFAKVALLAWVFTLAAGALPIPALQKSLQRSLVCSTCSHLPVRLRPDTRTMRRKLEGLVEEKVLGEIPDKLQEFRDKVDSAKAAAQ